MKTCVGPCQATLDDSAFAPNHHRRDGLSSYCRDCRRLLDMRRRKNNQLGRSDMVDAQPVREHIEQLLIRGMTRHQIAQLAGVNRTSIRHLVIGQPHANQGPAKRLHRRTATALLSVAFMPCEPERVPEHLSKRAGAKVDNTGTRRRLEALMANGWPAGELARRLGKHRPGLQLPRHQRVSSTTALAVRALYNELADLPGPSERARTLYRGRGYLPPLWWDDDTIDDPDASPAGLAVEIVDDGPATYMDQPRIDRVAHLYRAGYSTVRIAEHLNVSQQLVRRDISRIRARGPVKRIRRGAA